MSRQVSMRGNLAMSSGIDSDSNVLTFSKNCSSEDVNCYISSNGAHKRRLGLDIETLGGYRRDLDGSDSAHSYLWRDAGLSGKEFAVILSGTAISFFEVKSGEPVISGEEVAQTIILDSFILDSALFATSLKSFASGRGFLFITSQGMEPLCAEIDDDGVISVTKVDVTVRDTSGIIEDVGNTHSSAAITDEHKYNLINQGWTREDIDQYGEGPVKINVSTGSAGAWLGTISIEHVWSIGGVTISAHRWFNSTPNDGWNITGPISWDDVVHIPTAEETAEEFVTAAVAAGYADATCVVDSPTSVLVGGTFPAGANIRLVVRYYNFWTADYIVTSDSSGIVREVDAEGLITGAGLIKTYRDATGGYPNNSQQWWLGRKTEESINVNEVKNFEFGNRLAPRGRVILRAFEMGRDIFFPSLSPRWTKYTDERPSCCAFGAGRLFLALNDEVYYSQVIEDRKQVGRCYVEGDPTSENEFDVLASDGGKLRLSGCGRVRYMSEISGSIIVVAENGVWLIRGGQEGEAFSASSHAVVNISNEGCPAEKSCINCNGKVFFFGPSGINVVAANEYGNFSVASISDGLVRELFLDIDKDSRNMAVGVFDSSDTKVYWMYKSDVETVEGYDRALTMSLTGKGFSEYRFKTKKIEDGPIVVGMLDLVKGGVYTSGSQVIDSSNDLVVTSAEDEVYIDVEPSDKRLSSAIHICKMKDTDGGELIFIARYRSLEYKDFPSVLDNGGIDYKSWFTTGYDVNGNASLKRDIVYLIAHFERTEEIIAGDVFNRSGCLVSAIWNFENNRYSGGMTIPRQAWGYATRPQQAYNANRIFANADDEENIDSRRRGVITVRRKMRGVGRSIQIRFESESGLGFSVLGYELISGERF